MNLKKTRVECEIGGPQGRFRVVAEYDAEFGLWHAHMELAASGYASPEEAVEGLKDCAEAFIAQVHEAKKEEA